MPQVSSTPLPDVQAERDFRGRSIQKVGISNVRQPFQFGTTVTTQPTVGTWSLLASLGKDERGTHMSRLMEILPGLEGVQTVESLIDMCEQIRQRLSAKDAFATIDFPWFITKTAPISKSQGMIDFDVQIAIARGTSNSCEITLKVPATSLCPCSKSISDYGAHNQRCELSVSVRFAKGESISLEELFQITEASASTQLFSIIKRDDEKWVTEQAYENPKFVEDTVRDLAASLEQDSRIEWYRCSSENFESIHNHNAFAMIESNHPE